MRKYKDAIFCEGIIEYLAKQEYMNIAQLYKIESALLYYKTDFFKKFRNEEFSPCCLPESERFVSFLVRYTESQIIILYIFDYPSSNGRHALLEETHDGQSRVIKEWRT